MSSENKLHILIMPSWYKTPETPVLGTFFEEQARALIKEGHKVGIIYPEYTPPAEMFSGNNKEKFDFYMDKGMPTFNVKTKAGIPKLRRLSYRQFGNSIIKVYHEYVNNYGVPDIIHVHSMFHAGIAGFYIAKIHKIPFVITEHLTAYMMGYISNTIDLELSKEIFEYADGALIVSHNFRKDLEQHLNLREHTFTVIHNLVNDIFLDSFTPVKYQQGETFRFFTNSFLLPRKNINLIIDSLKILLDKHLNVHLTIGGDGPLEDTLKEYTKQLGIENHITFTGKLNRQQVKMELDNCHSFVLASQYETFGVVLIESLACGRPIVITDCGGPRDFVTTDHGIVVNEHRPENFARAMEQMVLNYDYYDQEALRDFCNAKFNQHKIAEELVDFYRQVLAKRIVSSI